MHKQAKFNIGQWVIHAKQGYRAVVIDADPLFQASGHYNPQAAQRTFAIRHPWYRLLVDGSSLVTYVEEICLIADAKGGVLDNPNASLYLNQSGDHYALNARLH